jgi:DNA-3-methyladenine glycosylase
VGRRPLPESFFRRPTRAVARALLGCRLVHRSRDGSEAALILVETEAYLGVRDPAAHTFGGRRTERVRPMWGPGGHAYIYFVYGMHHCMNVVTREEGRPEAVLLRAGVPEAWWRGEEMPRAALLEGSGPGRFCRALGLTTGLSGASLAGPTLCLEKGPRRSFEVLVGPRVGVDYAGEAAAWPLRYAVAGCPAVTRPRPLRPAALPTRSRRTSAERSSP